MNSIIQGGGVYTFAGELLAKPLFCALPGLWIHSKTAVCASLPTCQHAQRSAGLIGMYGTI